MPLMDVKPLRKVKPRKYLFFDIGDSIYTSMLEEIKEVVTDLKLDEVPIRDTFAIGMSSLRGEIISIFSLGKLLSRSLDVAAVKSPGDETQLSPINMVTLIIEHNNLKYGLVVDCIRQVDVLSADNLSESSECRWISGYYQLDDRIATVLSLKSLLESECP